MAAGGRRGGSLAPWQECAECGPRLLPGGRGRSQSGDPPEAAQRAEQKEMVWSSSLSKLNRWAGEWAQPGDRHLAPGQLSGAGPRRGQDPAWRPRDGGLGSRGDLHSARGRGSRGAGRARRGAAILVWEEARRQAAASPSPGHVAPPRAARGSGPRAVRGLR